MIKFADVILDMQQGDCGKGKISNHLAKSQTYTHVIRFNGSNNAGHTIYHEDKKLVTHSVPAGVIHGVKSIIGSGCVLNVKHFFKELKELEDAGITTKNKVFVANNTHIITEQHLVEDGADTKIGTTRRGNGPAYRDKYDRKGIRACEVSELKPYLVDMYEEFYGRDDCKILFEGAQGFYLDVDWGDYPYVTSSHCTIGSAIMNGVPPQKIRHVWGAAKIYETYVGSKQFEPEDPVFHKIRQIGNEYGATTGRPRQCNWLNLDNLQKAIQINGVTDLVFSKMDVLSEVGEWALYHRGNTKNFSSEGEIVEYIVEELNPMLRIYWSSNPLGL